MTDEESKQFWDRLKALEKKVEGIHPQPPFIYMQPIYVYPPQFIYPQPAIAWCNQPQTYQGWPIGTTMSTGASNTGTTGNITLT